MALIRGCKRPLTWWPIEEPIDPYEEEVGYWPFPKGMGD